MNVGGLDRVSIRVQDPERSRRFYEHVLGLAFMELPVSGDVVRDWRGHPSNGMFATQAGSTFVILAPPLEGTAGDDRFSEPRIGVDPSRSPFRHAPRWRSSSSDSPGRAWTPPGSRPTRCSGRSTWEFYST